MCLDGCLDNLKEVHYLCLLYLDERDELDLPPYVSRPKRYSGSSSGENSFICIKRPLCHSGLDNCLIL